MIISIVLHKVVKSNCIDFEDITMAALNKILSKEPSRYISIEDVNKDREKSKIVYYLITFDDGFLSDYNIVYPILKHKNIKATFFINPDTIGKNGYVSWSMVQEMSKYGMCIGSHSNSHPDMTKISFDKAEQELINSKQRITNNIKKNVLYFSFPFGSYTKKLLDLASHAGYQKCFLSSHGVIESDSSSLHRNSINKTMSFDDIDKVLKCSTSTRFKWRCEDFVKNYLKKLFGVKFYTFLRRMVLQ